MRTSYRTNGYRFFDPMPIGCWSDAHPIFFDAALDTSMAAPENFGVKKHRAIYLGLALYQFAFIGCYKPI
ncbi:MAG: hypothetical protein HC896_00690 [Bacteroidales bacterium]|nr:hypothetical protein [Bacteroidales bacterium]